MPNLFKRRSDLALRLTGCSILVVLVTLTVALTVYGSPHWAITQYRATMQPLQFSHEHHVGNLGLDCRYCHEHTEDSDFAGLPSPGTCMHCHSQLYTTAPMLEPVREAWRTGKPLAWNRVYRVPDFVQFSHKVHVHAGVSCVSCHGHVDEQPLIRQENPMTMGWCIDCHRAPEKRLVNIEDEFNPHAVPGSAPVKEAEQRVDRKGILTNCSVCHY